MLVEDDNNLREIYGARLLAEGFEIVSAKDGEEALAMAVKERPDLIISDIMMPKISGFDMLDILRSTPETKNTKVIMMTALSQSEDKERADKLGADRYLVKSQVTLEDVAKAAKEVLAGDAASSSMASPTPPTDPSAATPVAPTASTISPTAAPGTATPVQVAEQVNTHIDGASNISTVEVVGGAPVAAPATPVATPASPAAMATIPDPAVTPVATSPAVEPSATVPVAAPATPAAAVSIPVAAPAAVPTVPSQTNDQVLASALAAVTPDTTNPAASAEAPSGERTNTITPGDHTKTSVHSKVINPINDLSEPGNKLQELLAKEESTAPATAPAATTTDTPPVTPIVESSAPAEAPAAIPTAPGAVVNEVMQVDSDTPPTGPAPTPPASPIV